MEDVNRPAIEGGTPAKTTPNPPMFPGGLEIGEEERRAVLEVLEHQYLFRYYGPSDFPSKVRELEVAFAARMGRKHALAVNSCTSALISALVACGVGPGDEVIIPGYTFFATCAAVVAARAVPVIAEVDDSLTLDPADFERRITERTKAVMPVHMRGASCDMDRVMEIARRRGIRVIEDVAQAMGGTFRGTPLGSFGDCGCYSLQYHKIITSGEGGMVIMDDDLLYDRAQAYHDTAACWRPDRFGLPRYEGEVFPGVNYRMSELTGAVALAQLGKLDRLVGRMRYLKSRIKDAIADAPGLEFRRLTDPEGDTAICLVMYLPNPATAGKFAEYLQAEGVEAGTMYNEGVPDWHIYAHWKHIMDKVTATPEGCPYTCPYYKGPEPSYSPDQCPNTLAYLDRSLHLNIPPQMSDDDADMIAAAVNKVARAIL
jgi:dTDP-4-amino-4,6-dideoxygalactose transaminase